LGYHLANRSYMAINGIGHYLLDDLPPALPSLRFGSIEDQHRRNAADRESSQARGKILQISILSKKVLSSLVSLRHVYTSHRYHDEQRKKPTWYVR
jgi:hypothetical protein